MAAEKRCLIEFTLLELFRVERHRYNGVVTLKRKFQQQREERFCDALMP
jgi:hypothetical protein